MRRSFDKTGMEKEMVEKVYDNWYEIEEEEYQRSIKGAHCGSCAHCVIPSDPELRDNPICWCPQCEDLVNRDWLVEEVGCEWYSRRFW